MEGSIDLSLVAGGIHSQVIEVGIHRSRINDPDIVISTEHALSSVAEVKVDVDDQHSLRPGPDSLQGYGHFAEVAHSPGPVGCSVVARWADQGEGGFSPSCGFSGG